MKHKNSPGVWKRVQVTAISFLNQMVSSFFDNQEYIWNQNTYGERKPNSNKRQGNIGSGSLPYIYMRKSCGITGHYMCCILYLKQSLENYWKSTELPIAPPSLYCLLYCQDMCLLPIINMWHSLFLPQYTTKCFKGFLRSPMEPAVSSPNLTFLSLSKDIFLSLPLK